MKRIFLLSTMIISSFGIMNLNAAPQQAATPASTQAVAQPITPAVGGNAKRLVAKITQSVSLHGDQFSKVNNICIEFYQKLETLNSAKPADYDAKVAALKAERNSKIKAELDASQVKSFESFKD
jgi:hypothetical protein